MYIKNDIVYASEPGDEITVATAKPLPYGMLLLTFSSGEQRLFDVTSLQGEAFAPLKDAEVQKTAEVVHGYVTWKSGEIDCAPEYMYEHSFAYETDLVG